MDAAREEWWIGLRDAEAEHYTSRGGDFNLDEAKYRLGFEAALHPNRRGRSCDELLSGLKAKYGDVCATSAFREGYERGQRYQVYVFEAYKITPREEKHSRRAA